MTKKRRHKAFRQLRRPSDNNPYGTWGKLSDKQKAEALERRRLLIAEEGTNAAKAAKYDEFQAGQAAGTNVILTKREYEYLIKQVAWLDQLTVGERRTLNQLVHKRMTQRLLRANKRIRLHNKQAARDRLKHFLNPTVYQRVQKSSTF